MNKPAMVVDKLSKSYRIGHKAERFPTFRDAVVEAIGASFRRLGALGISASVTVMDPECSVER